MLTDTSALLEKINKAISKKWFQKEKGSSDKYSGGSNVRTVNMENGNDFECYNSEIKFQQLEERIAGLEKQNNQLLYFINFLVEQLPDLVINIMHEAQDEKRPSLWWESPSDVMPDVFKPTMHAPEKPPTPREQNVLELLQKGFCAKEIANRLFISETTVITHKKHLKEKFNAKNTAELISKANSANAR